MEENRVNRRYRPRPYDLRRKVLLKNFLREQMTYIPETRVELLDRHFDNNTAESPVSIQNDDLPVFSDSDASSSSEDASMNTVDTQISTSIRNTDVDPVETDSKEDNLDNTVADLNTSSDGSHESSLFKFASLVKLKKDPKKVSKGISKAKEVCKTVQSRMKTRSFKGSVEKMFNSRIKSEETTSSNQEDRSSPRSLFSLFKRRKDQRNNSKETPKLKRSACTIDLRNSRDPSKYNTANQSVQTDDSWARKELEKVQQSNRRLKEENRLLSESLSYFMSNSSIDSQNKNCSSPLQSSNNINSSVYSDYYIQSSNSSSNSWHSRPRVSRSKSVQEYNDKRNMFRNNYRTRSMSHHNYRNSFASANNKPTMSSNNAPFQGHIPRIRRKNAMNLPVNNSVRNIQRRSSMPARVLSENNRAMVWRRSGSDVRDTRSRQPFYSLPSEAFY